MKIKGLWLGFLFLMLLIAGCTGRDDEIKGMQSLSSVASSHGMQMSRDPGTETYHMGYTDSLFTLHPGQAQVQSGNQVIMLPDLPQAKGGELFLTPASVQKLFLDVSAPFDVSQTGPNGIHSLAVHPAVRAEDLLAFGRQFIGTPYRFTSKPYPLTHTFDCSSFVQYVYSHFGIELPRASKDQANIGARVARSDLIPGDLVFFNTPGRSSSKGIVGHVGIYLGNNQVLHTYGSPGVTITDIRRPSWSDRFVLARRVL